MDGSTRAARGERLTVKNIWYSGSANSLPKCRICHQRHALKNCFQFNKMDVFERRKVVKDKGFCFKCLCSAHTRDWCPSRKTCLVCNNNHHTMLHTDNNNKRKASQQNYSSWQNNHPKPSSSQNSSSGRRSITPSSSRRTSNMRRHRSPKPSVHERLSQRSKSHVFSPTALARALTTNGPDKIRLMLNSGGIQTFILRSMVQRLHLQTTRKEHTDFCTVTLQSYHDPSVKIQITGIVKSKFDIPLPKDTVEKELQSIYDHITTLADPHFFKPSDIEIIIGNDQLSKILLAGMIQTSSSMPIAQSTIFGWIISGACTY
ncbi:uncharacterized protein LOC131996853 isoform X1 [Stomoxys calcitrans]|uniref:uncharacterized protein LOC131996853 isoform X1 n=2 Tax=Stomoxys calcitrans TaxID=35570 RepID=UPI0027E250C4|nr:uncharacterized protein LOC131996853 isoform X1 [Stomoxys calcitrans]